MKRDLEDPRRPSDRTFPLIIVCLAPIKTRRRRLFGRVGHPFDWLLHSEWRATAEDVQRNRASTPAVGIHICTG
jgi:hypothetical protein